MMTLPPRRLAALLGAVLLTGGCAATTPTVVRAQSGLPENRYQTTRYDDSDPYDGWLFNNATGKVDPRLKAEQEKLRRAKEAWQRGEWLPSSKPATDQGQPLPGQSLSDPETPAGQIQAGAAARPAGSHSTAPPAAPQPSAEQLSEQEQRELAEKQGKGFDQDDISPEGVYRNLKTAVGLGPNKRVAEAALGEGERLFRAKKYDEAIDPLQTAADRWPDSVIQEDALFLLAESHFFSDRYPAAHDAYGTLLSKYSNSRYLDTIARREFAIGRYWEKRYKEDPSLPITPNLTDDALPRFDTFGHALEAYQRVRLFDPTGPLADDSVMAIANAYFVAGRFEEAAWNYDMLRREYPDSKHQAEAHLLGLEAKKRIYQGARYDGTALEDAQEIADQAITQFGGPLSKEKELLRKSRQELLEKKAMRDFSMAQFYETKKYYGSARYYYNLVLKNFPRTRTAERARQRLAAIKDLPDEPPNHFKWLTDLFPDDR